MKHPQNRAERRHKQSLADIRARAHRQWLMGTTDGWWRHRYNVTLCSCPACGNPRRSGWATPTTKRTLPELRAMYNLADFKQESRYE